MIRSENVTEWALRLNRRDSLSPASSGSVDRCCPVRFPARLAVLRACCRMWQSGRRVGENTSLPRTRFLLDIRQFQNVAQRHLALTNTAVANQPEPRWSFISTLPTVIFTQAKVSGRTKCSPGLVSREVREPHACRQSQMACIQDGVELIAEQNRRSGLSPLALGQIAEASSCRFDCVSTPAANQGASPTNEDRTQPIIPIFSDLRTVFENMRRNSDGMIFHGPRGGVLKSDTVRRILIRDVHTLLDKRFPKPADEPIGFVDGRLHSCRHYSCSVCARSVTKQVAMGWLDHSSSKMLRHYFHLHSSEAQHQMKKLDFFGLHGPISGSIQSTSE